MCVHVFSASVTLNQTYKICLNQQSGLSSGMRWRPKGLSNFTEKNETNVSVSACQYDVVLFSCQNAHRKTRYSILF